jgi:hypothetical protein
MPLAGKWMEPGIIMLSKISQSHKDKYPLVFFHVWSLGLGSRKNMKVKKGLLDREKGERESAENG